MDDGKGGFWVFGYGSLMWRPAFAFAERRMARAPGFRRRFCLRSIRYRGTPEDPGLVLGLDRDAAAACEGVAYRVEAVGAEATLAYLRERELVTYAYEEAVAPVALDDGRRVDALLYVVDPAHAQYAGALTLAEQAAAIRRCAGPAGTNLDYFLNTLAHLREIGVHDAELEALAGLVAP
jgi:cation transport protein ChaC